MIEHQRPVAPPESVTGRVAAIVAALAAQPGQSLTEVARAVELPLSTTRRLLCGLVDGMLADRTVEGRGIAAPIFGPSGVVAALEIVGRRYLPDLESFTPTLVYAARALGRRLRDHPALLPSGDGPTPLRWTVDPTCLIGRNGGGTPADGPSADALAARQLMSVPRRRRAGAATAVEPRSRPHGSRHEERSTWQT